MFCLHRVLRFFTQAVTAGFLSCVLASQASADGPILELANEPGFTERFAGNAQVSGQFLAGLTFAAAGTQLDLAQMRVAFTRRNEEAPTRICVKVTSDDGRYWASNLYRSNGIFATPPAVPLNTKYGEQLRTYKTANFLMLASFSESCDETAGKIYVPGLFGSQNPGDDLIAYVNVSQSKVSVVLRDAGGSDISSANCERPNGGAKVAFSHLCRLPVTELQSGTHEMIVTVKGLTGAKTDQRYAVHLE